MSGDPGGGGGVLEFTWDVDAEYRHTFIPSSSVWKSLSKPVGGRKVGAHPRVGHWCWPVSTVVSGALQGPFKQRLYTENELTKLAALEKGK